MASTDAKGRLWVRFGPTQRGVSWEGPFRCSPDGMHEAHQVSVSLVEDNGFSSTIIERHSSTWTPPWSEGG